MLAGGTLDGTAIIDEEALGETHVPHIVRSPPSGYDAQSHFYGLGWNVENDHLGFLRWAHSGVFTNGTGTTAVLLPTEQSGVVVLTNGMPLGVPEIIADEIVDQIATGGQTTDWREPCGTVSSSPTSSTRRRGWIRRRTRRRPKPDDASIGTYPQRNVYGETSRSSPKETGLALVEGPAKQTYPMTHLDGDTFTVARYPELPDGKDLVVFTMGSDGTASSMDIGDGEGPGTGQLTRRRPRPGPRIARRRRNAVRVRPCAEVRSTALEMRRRGSPTPDARYR